MVYDSHLYCIILLLHFHILKYGGNKHVGHQNNGEVFLSIYNHMLLDLTFNEPYIFHSRGAGVRFGLSIISGEGFAIQHK